MSCRAMFVVACIVWIGSATLSPSAAGAAEQANRENAQKASDASMNLTGIAENANQFAWELYARLSGNEGNLFLSPGSITMALAMTYAGAEGATRDDMAKTLHFQLPKPQLDEAMQELLTLWKKSDSKQGYHLHVANRLWGQKGHTFLDKFLETTRTNYGAELALVDFAQAPEAARQTINQWVEDQTQKKITDLIPARVLSSDSKLVLTNAVYFKGDWTEPFKKERTKDEDFKLADGQTVKVPLMRQEDRFRYGTADGVQVLELPYGDRSLSMVVLLPKDAAGLAELEARLSADRVRQWTTDLKAQEVSVYLPKFKTTGVFTLNDPLRALGMSSAFDPSAADFSGMTGDRDLFISQVVHRAFVDVNEEGTEAAAATGVVMGRTSVPMEKRKPVFRADHPFVFLIRDNRNGMILFLGRLTNPSP
jgi:serpin B